MMLLRCLEHQWSRKYLMEGCCLCTRSPRHTSKSLVMCFSDLLLYTLHQEYRLGNSYFQKRYKLSDSSLKMPYNQVTKSLSSIVRSEIFRQIARKLFLN